MDMSLEGEQGFLSGNSYVFVCRLGSKKMELFTSVGIEEAMRRGDDEASSIGTRVILPSSFTGGRRYMFHCC
ncbi:hypothetical protein Ahy_A03g014979 isoform B [Arachis hypogaea]|uniref:Uncharacterized protein n=1 Tax=Arachis hypogaea TaxID=3818 RepID=A0A445DZ59_ARAHY|nr:hypothetical protein Ahy_A03g014979 isoform B [Arachis hypogaea]